MLRAETVANARFVTLVLVVVGLTVLVTSIPLLQRLFGTTDLSLQQWGVCLLAVLGYLVVAEVARWVARLAARRGGAEVPAGAAVAAPARTPVR